MKKILRFLAVVALTVSAFAQGTMPVPGQSGRAVRAGGSAPTVDQLTYNAVAMTGTTPSLSWNTNKYIQPITADTTFSFANLPTDTNTVKVLDYWLVGDGTHVLTNSANTISFEPTFPGVIPTGTNLLRFTWVAGLIHADVTWKQNATDGVVGQVGGTLTNIVLGDRMVLSGNTLKRTNEWIFPISDMTTAITTGTNKNYFYAPVTGMTIVGVRLTASTVSSSGLPTVDINEEGTTILSTKLTLDANEKDSLTAATAAVISDSSIAANAYVSFDQDVAGTGTAGEQVHILWLVP